MTYESEQKIRVLFVCLGNICRSPMAEAVFADLARQAGLADCFEIDSAGTGRWHLGEPPHEGTQRVLNANKIAWQGRSRQITRADLDHFDYILAMDAENEDDIRALGGGQMRAKLARLLEYAPELGVLDVPDPYYTGGYEKVFTLVRAGAQGLLAAIRAEHGL